LQASRGHCVFWFIFPPLEPVLPIRDVLLPSNTPPPHTHTHTRGVRQRQTDGTRDCRGYTSHTQKLAVSATWHGLISRILAA